LSSKVSMYTDRNYASPIAIHLYDLLEYFIWKSWMGETEISPASEQPGICFNEQPSKKNCYNNDKTLLQFNLFIAISASATCLLAGSCNVNTADVTQEAVAYLVSCKTCFI